MHGYSVLNTFNRSDVHPIVGPAPLKGFHVASGISGHGFKLAPAIGSIHAQQISGVTTDFDTDVNGAFLSFDCAPINVATKSVLA